MFVSAQTTAKTFPGTLLSPCVWLSVLAPGSVRAKTIHARVAHARGLMHTAHQGCFPVGSSNVQLSATSGTHFLGGPGGEFCIPGIKFSLQWLRGQLVGVFKCRNDGNPSHFLSSLQDPKLPQFHERHHPLSLRALVTETVFYDWIFKLINPICQMLKLSRG